MPPTCCKLAPHPMGSPCELSGGKRDRKSSFKAQEQTIKVKVEKSAPTVALAGKPVKANLTVPKVENPAPAGKSVAKATPKPVSQGKTWPPVAISAMRKPVLTSSPQKCLMVSQGKKRNYWTLEALADMMGVSESFMDEL